MLKLLRFVLIASAAMLASCFNAEAIHPDNVLQGAANKAVVIFSTSTQSSSASFALAINLEHVNDEGKRGPAPGDESIYGYFIDNAFQQPDIPAENAHLAWRTLAPGSYVFIIGHANAYQCLTGAPEYSFSVEAGQVLYLGDFHRDGEKVELTGSYSRDVGYFRAHAVGAHDVKILPATMTIRNVEYPCAQQIKSGRNSSGLLDTDIIDPHGTPTGATFTVPGARQ